MKSWQEVFKEICERMKENNETQKSLSPRGKITWYSIQCPNCNSQGVFYGDELDCGLFYECASAYYCPNCRNLFGVSEGQNFAPHHPEKFLPIMKQKLMTKLDWDVSLVKEEFGCPFCGGPIYTFHKDLGVIYYWDNYWRVCPNPDCNWPGEHSENFSLDCIS